MEYFQFLIYFKGIIFNLKIILKDMKKQKTFLLFAILVGIVGVVIGSITLFSSLDGLSSP
jgi:hypothetical protein